MVALSRLIGLVAGFFVGIIVHEYAHAKVANLLGDRYPRMQGRMTLKPKPHVDTIGTVVMPAIFTLVSLVGHPFGMVFGYGKKIEYNNRALRHAKRDQILIAIAGPAVNLAFLIICGSVGSRLTDIAGFVSPRTAQQVAGSALLMMMSVNAYILIINVFPVPPLDGSKALMPFLSSRAQLMMDEYSQYLLLFIVIVFFLLQGVIGAMASPLCRAVSSLPGCPL